MLNRERILATNENPIQSVEAPAVSPISTEATLKFGDCVVKRKKMDAFKQKFDFLLSLLLHRISAVDAFKLNFNNRRLEGKV